MRRLLSFIPTFAFLLLAITRPAHAGNNAGGAAFLSWDRAGLVDTLSSAPPADFPVYVHISGASDIRGLAIWIQWSPSDSASSCYTLAPSPTALEQSADPDSTCGLGTAGLPNDNFIGDSTYTWSITFPTGTSARRLIAYVVSAPSCPNPPPASFRLASVIAIDSNDLLDTLAVGSEIAIAPDPVASSVTPNQLMPGELTTVTVEGSNLQGVTGATLEGSGWSAELSNLVLSDSSHFQATVNVPGTTVGIADLVLETTTGVETVLPGAATITTSTPAYISTPTNDYEGFYRLPITSPPVDQYMLATQVSTNVPVEYDSTRLIVTRAAGDTVGIFNSQVDDGIGLATPPNVNWTSFARYNLNRHATSIGLLALGGQTIMGPGGWNAGGRSLLHFQASYADGSTYTDSLIVGTHIRNYRDGMQGCTTEYPMFDTKPTSPLCGEIETNFYQGHDWFYDVQEFRFPKDKRGVAITSLKFVGDVLAYPQPCFSATSAIFGVSLWDTYEINNSGGNTVPQDRQDGSSAGDLYGGILYQGQVLGSDGTMAENGCLATCVAMIHQYRGVSLSAGALNAQLQSIPTGYEWSPILAIDSVVVDTVYLSGTRELLGLYTTELLIESLGRPLVTLHIDPASVRFTTPDSLTARGTVAHRHNVGALVHGQVAGVYNQVNVPVAAWLSKGTTGEWMPTAIGGAPEVEARLAAGLPVILGTEVVGNGPTHWVVAHGQEAAIDSSFGRSTYKIRDPLPVDSLGRAITRLVQQPHGNLFFTAAIACSSLTVPPVPSLAQTNTRLASVDAVDIGGFSLVLTGNASLSVVDPLGRAVTFDENAQHYVSTIPGCLATRRVSPKSSDAWADIVDLPGAGDGNYTVTINPVSDGNVALSAMASNATDSDSRVLRFASARRGRRITYALSYDSQLNAFGVTTLDVVPGAKASSLRPTLGPNPCRAQLAIDWGTEQVDAKAEVFDLGGRRVALLRVPDGERRIVWDCRGSDGRRVQSGVYFVRTQAGRSDVVQRVVVLK